MEKLHSEQGFDPLYKKRKRKRKRSKSNKRLRLLRERENVCHYCSRKIDVNSATLDHVIPKSKGGSNEDDNLVLACKKCNEEKADKYPYP